MSGGRLSVLSHCRTFFTIEAHRHGYNIGLHHHTSTSQLSVVSFYIGVLATHYGDYVVLVCTNVTWFRSLWCGIVVFARSPVCVSMRVLPCRLYA